MRERFIVYGSLRPGEFNFERFSQHLRHVEDTSVSGYDLYDLGPYPAAVSSSNKDSRIEVSVIEADAHVAPIIRMMEEGAGYTPKNIAGLGTIFVYPHEEGIRIPSGNWRDRHKNRKTFKNA